MSTRKPGTVTEPLAQQRGQLIVAGAFEMGHVGGANEECCGSCLDEAVADGGSDMRFAGFAAAKEEADDQLCQSIYYEFVMERRATRSAALWAARKQHTAARRAALRGFRSSLA